MRLPEGPKWTYEILCGVSHKISYVVSIFMFRRGSESVSLLAAVALNTT
jgi:hypothetical protein